MGLYSYDYPPYVPVAERKAQAARLITKLKKQGQILDPVTIEGRVIARTFWGKSWCKNLESYSDFSNRLPRGRTYVRNGSVINLHIGTGKVTALVSGSSIYKVNIECSKILDSKWENLVAQCSGKIDSLIELLQGKFSKSVMEIITRKDTGLFPNPKEIKLECSCPDYATLCKHVAAVLYGVGSRLDTQPEALFLLRQANHIDLIENAKWPSLSDQEETTLDGNLSSLFGIELADSQPEKKPPEKTLKKSNKTRRRQGVTTIKRKLRRNPKGGM